MDIVTDPDILSAYNQDALGLQGNFEGVFRPSREEEIIEFLGQCAAEGKCVTAQGLRSSLTGASVCDRGYALSLEKMNRIIDIDVKRRRALVQPGVITEDFRKAVAEAGLFYPLDPTSAGECTIGGNVATNASGSGTLKYGSTGDWVRRVRVVDGLGRLVEAGRNASEKHSAGYGALVHPLRLFLGSEGTLGIVTEIEFGLHPQPPESFLVMVFFTGIEDALNFVIEARESRKYSPRSMEFLDEACLEILRPRAEGISIPGEARVMLYFEQEYRDEEDREKRLENWLRLIERYTRLDQDTQVALSDRQKRHLLDLRHHVPQAMNEESARAVRNGGCKISTDWAVPYRRLPELFTYYDSIKDLLGDMLVVRFAHLGEGHPHFNFIARNEMEKQVAEHVDFLLARKAVELGGTVAGEHGIGKMKREHLSLEYPERVIEAMKAIKKVFDPKGILAPGNIFP
ncbi:MAG: FAD-binding oxidoreductase [Deltaproteobacteria bacterium]|nr:FAD-binding oxidoreductase [Deltaproteobacteria bacterium]